MQTSTALWNHVRENDLCPGADSLQEWQNVNWIKVRIGGKAIPIFPVIGYREALHLHDVHHLLTGYSTRLDGELELAAWEIASGGCHRHIVMWIDRLLACLLAFVFLPRRAARAWKRGWRCKNAYRLRTRDVLAMDLDELRATVLSS
jgi:hypothetical protein